MLYSSFDWKLLESPEFKEDSVREELISPLLIRLGYSASGPNRIFRSKAVKHPFVYLGSRPQRIELIPDYVFEVSGKSCWVLDAKAPCESTRQGKNPQQAYSYAIHPQIRVQYFALCNGRDFTVFDIFKETPTLDFPLRNIHDNWPDLAKLLAPETFLVATNDLNPDLGLHLHRLGMSHVEELHFVSIAVPLVGRVTETNYTISGQYMFGDERFCASFDFDASLLPRLFALFPESTRAIAADKLSRAPFQADLRSVLPHVTVTCRLGDEVEATHDQVEHFCPLHIIQFNE
jgi:Type I restriction enzyme R protein N terminus (HSDR_N)